MEPPSSQIDLETPNSQVKGQRERRSWSRNEEIALIECLEEVVAQGKRCDDGTFKAGTLKAIEDALVVKFPESRIKVKPHIESSMQRLKTKYTIVYDIQNMNGFGWDDEKKCILVDSDDVWQAYVQVYFCSLF